MTSGLNSLIAAASLALLTASAALADETPLTITDQERPVAAMLQRLGAREGWAVTYEDDPLSSSERLSLELRYSRGSGKEAELDIQEAALRKLLEQHATHKKGTFRLERTEALWHVVPTSGSPFDAGIQLSGKKRPLRQVLTDFCAAVEKASGKRVVLGRVGSLPLDQVVTVPEGKASARVQLARLLAPLPGKSVWSLVYNEDLGGFILTAGKLVRVVPMAPPAQSTSGATPN
ncbi:hypothetical protein JQX13_47195 [Archangium violaceum]|uniref:hypothetical protein n=1 Tax=Archangium violaceum TaxID=83451 RepID=UPI00193BCBC7|nr:hypothetical protein [Archangium violaceum]QRK07513.1 hypothetical protein JQX13_47195 [Archangium violaceum]